MALKVHDRSIFRNFHSNEIVPFGAKCHNCAYIIIMTTSNLVADTSCPGFDRLYSKDYIGVVECTYNLVLSAHIIFCRHCL